MRDDLVAQAADDLFIHSMKLERMNCDTPQVFA